MQRLRDQVALLQRNAEKDQELLCRKDEELHNRRRPSPPSSHSGRDGHGGGGGVIETKGGIGNHPIIIKSEKGILSRKEQFLHLPTRLEEKSKVGGGGKGGLEDHSLTLGSLQHRTFPVRIP